jgi:peroxiredoxin
MLRSLILLLSCAVALNSVQAAESSTPVGRKVEAFTLKDYRGAAHSLSDFDGRKLMVVAFLGTECPLAKLYAPRLAALAQKYEPQGVAFVGINSNRQDSLTEIAAHARTHQIEFPVLKDLGNAVADQMGAVRTPEVFVLDQNRVIRYRGRIDDQYGVGYIRDKVDQQYLAQALDQLLAGQEVATAETESAGCYIGRVRDVKASDVTYSNQIARIFRDRCVECHREGEIAPFALSNYEEVAGWADTIAEVVRDRRMPPWHADPEHGTFANDLSLSAEEKELIYTWAANGAPEGNPSDLPEPRHYLTGWSLPMEPDFVVNMQPEPFKVPAEGEVEYQNFMVDPGFTEDKWVKASQIVPGNAAVVHHVLAFVRQPGDRGRNFDENGLGFLAAYVPGNRAKPFPEGMAKFVPAGSRLVFQVHYTPIGSEQLDQGKLGLVFAKPEEITHLVQTVSTGDRGFRIPPHDDNYRAEATMVEYQHPLQILSFSPHMHLRGKSFLYEAIYPDGNREVLLDVPRYDFNWQTSYELAEAKVLPPGAKVHCVAHWDNSENNLSNPDPSATVRWGDQTWEEMMIGFFDVAVPVDREKLLAEGTIPQLQPKVPPAIERAKELIAQFDADGDGELTIEEVPDFVKRRFDELDQDGDDELEVEEVAEFVKRRGGR